MSFVIPAFRGLVEIVAPQRLETGQATEATNCRIESGDLVPYTTPELTVDTGTAANGTHSIFKYSANRWVRWNVAVNAARTPATDSYGRLYYTESTNNTYPKVTDTNIIGATNGGPVAASRRVGIPAPNGLLAITSGIVGFGEISEIVFRADRTASQSKATVTTTEAHGLSNADTVVMDFPGVDLTTVYRVQVVNATKFVAVGLKLKQAAVTRFIRDGSGDDLIVRAPGHGFNSGDRVRVWTSTRGAIINCDESTTYTIEVVDANKFTLLDTADTDTGLIDAVGFCAQIVDVTNPLQQSGGEPFVTWFNHDKYWQVAANGNYGDGRTAHDWYRSDIQALLVDRYYCITFVNGYGQEGPPSAPVLVEDINPGVTTVDMSWYNESVSTCGLRGDGSGVRGSDLVDQNGWYVTHVRVYRTDSTGNWRLVNTTADIAFSAEGYEDLAADSALGEVLSTTGYIDPPDTLAGLICTPNGVFMGYVGKEVYAAVPYQPHAWPLAYRVKSDFNIQGLVATGAGVIVLTDGFPALLAGTDPASWELVKLEIPQSCSNPRSIVDMGEWGMYASPDGLVAIQQNDAKVVTQMVFNRAQWQTRTPASVFGAFFEGRYFGVSPLGAFVFDPATGDFVDLDFDDTYTVVALFNDLVTDTLYFLGTDGKIRAFDRGNNNLSMTWTSQVFQGERPVGLTAAQAVVEGLTRVAFLADGAEVHAQNVTDSTPFRLPRVRALNWQTRITGRQRVKRVAAGVSIAELRQV